MLPNLKIIILNLNLRDDTLYTINSLAEAGVSPKQVILVDNGSTDGSVDAIRNRFGNDLHIIENQQNMGFAEGNNQGARLALELGAEWMLLLNNDTCVAPDFLERIEQAIRDHPDYKILSPAIYYFANPQIIWHMGAKRIPGSLLGENLYQGRTLPDNLPDLLPVDFISGCAMFLHRDIYRQIGLFDPGFFAYWEEVDFCYRARRKGFQIAVIPRAKIWHKVSLTANRDYPRKRYLYTRNMVFYTRKNARGIQWPIMVFYLCARLLSDCVKSIFSHEKDLLKPLITGWIDGWRKPVIR